MKNKTEREINEEIQRRVFEEQERRKNAEDRKIEIDALSEVSELGTKEVTRIAAEVRAEFAAGDDNRRKWPVWAYAAGILAVIAVIGFIGFQVRAHLLEREQIEAKIKSAELFSDLKEAVKAGNLAMSEYLLNQGAPLQVFVDNLVAGFPGRYDTALSAAAYWGYPELVKLFLARGADVKIVDGRGWTALDEAVKRDSLPLIQILGKAMAEAYPEDSPVRRLWAKGIPFARYAFVDRVRQNDLEATRLFIAGGMDLNAEGKVGQYDNFTALQVSARDGNLVMVRLLLSLATTDNKPDLNEPLEFAVWKDRLEVVNVLLEAGADPDSVPFRDALNSPEIAELFLKYGADINKGTGDRNVPALIEVLEGSTGKDRATRKKHVAFLLAHGADVTRRGEEIATALDLAKAWGDPDVIRWITEAEEKKADGKN